jgi:sec-independent protein translocase protein TatB
MFEVGFTEIILILGIALVVLGPEKLPKVAADIGRWVGRARAMARQFKSQLDEEVVKADRSWTRPETSTHAAPKKPGVADLDASPNRNAPPPVEEPPLAQAAPPAPASDPPALEPAAGPATAGPGDAPVPPGEASASEPGEAGPSRP